jgi:hypothetical protein
VPVKVPLRVAGLEDRGLGALEISGWLYWLPNPLLPFIWWRVALPGGHSDVRVEVLEAVILGREDSPPFLKDHTAYLVAERQPGPHADPGISPGGRTVIGTGTDTADPELGIV